MIYELKTRCAELALVGNEVRIQWSEGGFCGYIELGRTKQEVMVIAERIKRLADLLPDAGHDPKREEPQ